MTTFTFRYINTYFFAYYDIGLLQLSVMEEHLKLRSRTDNSLYFAIKAKTVQAVESLTFSFHYYSVAFAMNLTLCIV